MLAVRAQLPHRARNLDFVECGTTDQVFHHRSRPQGEPQACVQIQRPVYPCDSNPASLFTASPHLLIGWMVQTKSRGEMGE